MVFQTSQSLLQAREDFLKLRFGMFIHFGLYSQGEEHEWHMHLHKMSLSKYRDQFLKSFNPNPKGIEQWVITAKKMGAKYLVCTSKHCDGFCLWDTEFKHGIDPNYHIRNTLFWENNQKGVLDYLFEAGRKHDIKIGLYHAVVDWSWSEKPMFGPPRHGIKNDQTNQHFIENMQERLLELIHRYPDVLLFWLDGYVMVKDGFKRLNYVPMYQKLHEAKPKILIGCNSGTTQHEFKTPVSDILLFENLAGKFEINPVVWPRHDPELLPAEACLTLNEHWGWNATDKDYKNSHAIARLVLENQQRRGNTLLNFGPMPNGYISEEQVEIAEKIGFALKSE